VFSENLINRNDAYLTFDRTLPHDLSQYSEGQDLFVPAQNLEPVFGNTQGLMIRYNCLNIWKLSDFTILNQFSQRGDNSTGLVPNLHDSDYKSTTIGNDTVFLHREATGSIEALSEVGISGTNRVYGYYDIINNSTSSYRHGGIGHKYVLEYALYEGMD